MQSSLKCVRKKTFNPRCRVLLIVLAFYVEWTLRNRQVCEKKNCTFISHAEYNSLFSPSILHDTMCVRRVSGRKKSVFCVFFFNIFGFAHIGKICIVERYLVLNKISQAGPLPPPTFEWVDMWVKVQEVGREGRDRAVSGLGLGGWGVTSALKNYSWLFMSLWIFM